MTFFFYDLETSGFDARWQRIMQFAGQRTDEDFKPIGQPINVLVKISEDILPDPDAVLITKITPQQTLQDGITEVELLKLISKEAFTEDTIALGFNSIRFDDEFMRYTYFRSFFDPYEREWADGRGRWDVLDVARMTRALRPDGIKWPTNEEGKPTNRLEALTKANKIEHGDAHDALADVQATIEIAKLIKNNQPKLYDHLLSVRHKSKLAKLINVDDPKPLVHSSGRFSSDHASTSVVIPLSPHPTNPNAILVYDLRHSPKPFADMNAQQLMEAAFTPWKELAAKDQQRLPIKAIHLNKSPAVAPLGVLDDDSQKRIKLAIVQVETHLKELRAIDGFAQRVHSAWDLRAPIEPVDDPEGQLYDGFINDNDRKKMADVRAMSEDDLLTWEPDFSDERLQAMVLPYKARNFQKLLSSDERLAWENYRKQRLTDSSRGLSIQQYFNRLAELAQEHDGDEKTKYLLEELQLYGQSIMPFENETLLEN